MWKLPFISREHHEDVVKGYERNLVALRAQVAMLEKRLMTPVEVSVKLPDDFAMLAPAVVRSKRAQDDVKPKISRAPIDESKWAEYNEKDLAQLAKLAVEELGKSQVHPMVLAQTIDRIKRRILTAKTNRAIRQMEVGTVGAIVPPSVKVESNPEQDIPEEIRQRIEMAERGQ